MQQHTGQHLLSAAFDRLFSARTVSFHLGADSCTIDLSREMAPGEIAAAEAEANRVVWEDRPVSIRFVTAEEAARLPLRKEPAREGLLRLIDIEGFDLSACGGTHVERTGAVGIVAATAVGAVQRRSASRVRLRRPGARAGSSRFAITSPRRRAGCRSLPGELAPAIERLQGEAKDLKRAGVALQADLARYRAQEMVASAERMRFGVAVCQVVEGEMPWLKLLAASITAEPGRVAVLVSNETPVGVIVAASPTRAFRPTRYSGSCCRDSAAAAAARPTLRRLAASAALLRALRRRLELLSRECSARAHPYDRRAHPYGFCRLI